MKRILRNVVFGFFLTLPMCANAAWVCHAQSSDGWGRGVAPTQGGAAAIAMNECRWRTAAYNYCVIIDCWWE